MLAARWSFFHFFSIELHGYASDRSSGTDFVRMFRRETKKRNTSNCANASGWQREERELGPIPFWRCLNTMDKNDCAKRGFCKMPDDQNPLKFKEKISREQLMRCPQANPSRLNPSKTVKFQIYHLSKCGGSTLQKILNTVLTEKGKLMMLPETENMWDYKRYPTGEKADDVFIIGMIRDPFEFYVSYWSMFSIQLGLRDCTRFDAFKQGKFDDFFDNTQTHNVTKFREYIHWQLVEMCDSCHHNLWGYINDLIGRPGDCPAYDGTPLSMFQSFL